MSLPNAIIEAQLASPDAVEEALARQELYGGDLVTQLLAVVSVEEQALLDVVARTLAGSAAASGELPPAAPAALQLVSRDTARELDVYPLDLTEGTLTVAVADPSHASALLAELPYSRVRVRALLALTPRIRQAIARDYALTLDPASQSALAHLTRDAGPTALPPPVGHGASATFSALPRPRSAPPFGFPDDWSDALTPTGGSLLAETARQPTVVAPSFAYDRMRPQPSQALLDAEVSLAPSEAPQITTRGPYSLARLCEDLQNERRPDEVLASYAHFAAQFFDYTALITLRGDYARVRAARGRGAPLVEAGANRLLIQDYPLLRELRNEGRYRICPLVSIEPKLAELFAREEERSSLFIPLKVRGRVLLLLFGANDDTPASIESVGELLAAEPFVSQAFERAIHFRKMPSLPPLQPLPRVPKKPFAPPPRSQRARILADALNDE